MENVNEIILTPEGRQKLVEELEWREGEKDAEIIQLIKEARAQGDLSENSEYDAAKEEQSRNQSRIAEIRQILSTAKVQDASSARGGIVSIGSTITLEDAAGKETQFTIVGTTETNSLEHKISNESPAGAALIGHRRGDKIEFSSPSGKVRSYTIVGISR